MRDMISGSTIALLAALSLPARPISTIADLRALLDGQPSTAREFCLTGLVTFSHSQCAGSGGNYFNMQDESGHMEFWPSAEDLPATGQVVQFSGAAYVTGDGRPWVDPNRMKIRLLGHRPVPPPHAIRVSEIDEWRQAYETLRLRGTVIGLVRDDIDPDFDFLLLKDGSDTLPVALHHGQVTNVQELLDAEISVLGVYRRGISGKRAYSGPFLNALARAGLGEIKVIRPAPTQPLDWPALETSASLTPREITRLGRRSAEGVVLAAWEGNRLLIRSGDNRLIGAELAEGVALPTAGDRVKVAGYPVTDLYQIKLVRAMCQTTGRQEADQETPTPISVRNLLFDRQGRTFVNPDGQGRLLTFVGTVCDLPQVPEAPLVLRCDNKFLNVFLPPGAVSAETGLAPGCTVQVTGRCIFEAETWTPDLVFPRLKGVLFVTRTPDDICIISRPPWWTPRKFLAVIAGLLVALAGFLVWIRILNRLATRRGHELYRLKIAETVASLKIGERTRLATELHDSLSQNLSALAFQVSAAKCTTANGSETRALLTTAERMLLSSRTELTRCLWDLRNDTLEEANFTTAIRGVLDRLAFKAAIAVRFNVPRPCVDDTTAHAILCIVRELVTNAVRHGAAKTVRVAGETHGDLVSFSVRDDGIGFDVERSKGIAEGHFGLDGIRSRVTRLGGTFEIDSRPGEGTKATVTIRMKWERTGEEFNA